MSQAQKNSASMEPADINKIAEEFCADEHDSVAGSEVRMPIGQVVSINGAQLLVMIDLNRELVQEYLPRVGNMICIETGNADIVAGVSALSAPTPGLDADETQVLIAELELIGEFRDAGSGNRVFRRGVSSYPVLGDCAAVLTADDQTLIHGQFGTAIRVGQVSDAQGIPANLNAASLLHGNFLLMGAAGSGKSAAAAVIARALVKNRHPARIVILDFHDEYTRSFGRAAHIVRLQSGTIAHWMLSFRELVHVLGQVGGNLPKAEIDLLAEAIGAARKKFVQSQTFQAVYAGGADTARVSVDSPIPYRVSDVSSYLDRTSQVEQRFDPVLVSNLKNRLDAAGRDPQCRIFFGSVSAQDTLAAFLGDLFRIPLDGKPVSVLQLSGLEPEICEVAVSVVARYAALIAEAKQGGMPILLLLEEAHRFLPADPTDAPITSRSLGHVLEQSLKLPLSFGLVTERVRSLSSEAVENCLTMLAMRLPSRVDQEYLREILPEAAPGLVDCVGIMDRGECIAIGQGAPVPMRLVFSALPADAVPMDPATRDARKAGDLPPATGNVSAGFLDKLVERWRFADD